MEKYAFRPYHTVYAKRFSVEKRCLRILLGNGVAIEHVGSTAVPGLGGKGILDIVIGVPRKEMKKIKKKLEGGGYEFRQQASTPQRFFFRKNGRDTDITKRVHLHLVSLHGKEWGDMILFRGYLRTHKKAVQAYSMLKRQAAKKAKGEGEVYRRYKEGFIRNILKS